MMMVMTITTTIGCLSREDDNHRHQSRVVAGPTWALGSVICLSLVTMLSSTAPTCQRNMQHHYAIPVPDSPIRNRLPVSRSRLPMQNQRQQQALQEQVADS
eukprot:1442871-Rhodomonas_salina.1